jgi:hypothetical protein
MSANQDQFASTGAQDIAIHSDVTVEEEVFLVVSPQACGDLMPHCAEKGAVPVHFTPALKISLALLSNRHQRKCSVTVKPGDKGR